MLLAMSASFTRAIGVAFFGMLSVAGYSQSNNVPLWKVLYDSGNLYIKTDAGRSVRLLSRAETVARNDLGIYDYNYLVILSGLGFAHEQTRNFAQARKYFLETVSLSHEIYPDDDPRLLQSMYSLGMILGKAGNYNESSKIFKEISQRSEKTTQRDLYVSSSTQLVNIYERRHQLDSALAISRKIIASPLLKDHESVSYELRVAEGRILRKLRLYKDSQTKLVSLSKQLVARGSAFRMLTRSVDIQLALLDSDLGLYGKSEKSLLQLYRSLKSENNFDTALTTEVTNAIAFVYEKLGVYDKAIAYYQESLGLCSSGQGIGTCDAIQNNIAGIYLKQQQLGKAISGYRAYIDSRHDSERFNDPEFLTALNNLATALRQNNQYDQALQYFNEIYGSLTINNRGHDDLAATVLNNIAVTQILKGEYVEATMKFQKALEIKESIYGPLSPLLVDLCGNLGVALWASGKPKESLPYFERSLHMSLRQVKYNFQTLTEAEQVQFYARQKETFERFNTLAVQSAKETPQMLVQMFDNQLFLKSLRFFTNRKATNVAKGLNDASLRDILTLKETKSTQLGHHYQTPLKELESRKVSLSKLENEIDSLDKIIRHRLMTDTGKGDDLTWVQVQKKIDVNGVSIDIIRFRKYDVLPNTNSTTNKIKIGFTDSIYYAALITRAETKNNPELVLMKNGRDLESRFFSYYKNTIKFDLDDTISVEQYWAPVENKLAGKTTLYFSPDGIYRQINLNTIRDHRGRYNIEKYDIHSSLNSASIVTNANGRPVDLSGLTLIGDPIFGFQQAQVGVNSIQSSFAPLPGTQQELAEIAKLVKSNPPPVQYVRAEASEKNLRKIKPQGILHIATHGFFSIDVSYLNEQVKSEYLFHSGLLLSAGKSENHPTDNDGIVTAYDILNLDLRKIDLVVLSACETGLGKNENGEGIHGLQRSFMQAGAKEVIISLWRVDDRLTKDLMVKFYQYLLQKKPANEALRLSQIDLMKKEPSRRVWGSFIIVGSN